MEFARCVAVSDGDGSVDAGMTVRGKEDMGEELRRGPWTVEEDLKLVSYIRSHGEGRWNSVARCAGLKRTGKSCRLRWLNYLRPDVRRGNITPEEQLLILQLHARWGNRWSKIAQHLPGRTDNEIKNYWRTRVQKHAKQLKCDVNSQQFKEVLQHLWIPRLVERIGAKSGEPAAAPPMIPHLDHDTVVPTMTVPHHQQTNGSVQATKISPESSIDSMGTTTPSQLSSPPMSDFTTAATCHVVPDYSVDDWAGGVPPALGFDDDQLNLQGLLDLDGGWGCGDPGEIAGDLWSSVDDMIWSLQQ